MKIYCQACGLGVSYEASKPKFCSNCGHAHFPSSKTQEPLPNKITQDSRDEEFAAEKVPNITSLDIEIDTDFGKSTKLQNLLGTSNGNNYPQENHTAPILSKQEFLESFKKEAGFYPSRQSIDETESD